MGRKIRTVSGLVSALLLVGVFVGTAFGVGTSDLDNNSVTSAKIRDGNVRTPDLDGSAVTSGKIANATIKAADLAPELAKQAGMVNFGASSDLTGNAQELLEFTVTAPGDGVLLLNLTGNSYVERDAAAGTETVTEVILGLCKTSGSPVDPSCGSDGDDNLYLYFADYDNDATDNFTEVISLWRKFNVSAGVNTFYVNVDVNGAFSFDLGACCGGANITAFFSPKSLTMSVV